MNGSCKLQANSNNFICRRIIIKNSETSSYQLKTLSPNFKGAVCSSLDEVVYMNQKNFKTFTFRISNEYLKTSPVAFYFPKNSFLVHPINEKLGILQSAGLIDFWIAKHMDLKYVKVSDPPVGARILNFHQLSGIFSVLCAGCVIAFLIFIVEVLSVRLKKIKIFSSNR